MPWNNPTSNVLICAIRISPISEKLHFNNSAFACGERKNLSHVGLPWNFHGASIHIHLPANAQQAKAHGNGSCQAAAGSL